MSIERTDRPSSSSWTRSSPNAPGSVRPPSPPPPRSAGARRTFREILGTAPHAGGTGGQPLRAGRPFVAPHPQTPGLIESKGARQPGPLPHGMLAEGGGGFMPASGSTASRGSTDLAPASTTAEIPRTKDGPVDSSSRADSFDSISIEEIAAACVPSGVGAAPCAPVPPPAFQASGFEPDHSPRGRPIDPEAWNQLVEHAQIVEGSSAMRLTLGSGVHGGLAMEIRSLGNGRVALHVASPTGSIQENDQAIGALRQALSSRDLEVASIVCA